MVRRIGIASIVALAGCSGPGEAPDSVGPGSTGEEGNGVSTTSGATTPAPTTVEPTATVTTAPTTGVDPTGDPALTWYRDVLPVAQVRCMGCHLDGGIGPFSLEDVEVAQAFAPVMAASVASRSMPPWMPDANCREFHDARVLTAEEIALFQAWSDAGAPAGDPNDAPPPVMPPSLPTVDVALAPAIPYAPSDVGGKDDYHCMVLDPQQADDVQVVGYEVTPGQPSMVHHVLLYAVDRKEALANDPDGTGWTCFGGPGVGGSPKTIGAWAPGTPVQTMPAGTGLPLLQSEVIVMQVHYNFHNVPGEAPPDQTLVELQFADTPVAPAQMMPLFNSSFSIPPGAVGHTDSVDRSVPVPVRLFGLLPHMHQLGRRITLQSDALGCLIDIPAWDFHWQQFYFYRDHAPVLVPGNSSVTLSCTWDNPTAETVHWGESTADEMCLAFLYVAL
jgi:hypothetical protein